MNYTAKLFLVLLAFGTSAFAGEGKPADRNPHDEKRNPSPLPGYPVSTDELTEKLAEVKRKVDASQVPSSGNTQYDNEIEIFLRENTAIMQEYQNLNSSDSNYKDQCITNLKKQSDLVLRFTQYAREKGIMEQMLPFISRMTQAIEVADPRLTSSSYSSAPISSSETPGEQALKERNASPEFQQRNEQALREMSRRRYSVASKGLALGAISGGLYVAAYHFGYIQGPVNFKTAAVFTTGCALGAAGCGYKAHKLKVPSSDRRLK